jgi:acetylornithine deacetylase/succinyl-diaminopimelate desuccinylase-like protein
MLLGHSATVFPKGTAAQRPMQIAGPKILGPGVCDMKGGLLTGLYAVQALQAKLNWRHRPDEYIEMARIMPRTALLAGAIRGVCQK